jgi:hypothetical protein
LGGIVASVVGFLGEEDGPVTEELGEVATRPGGAGSFVVALADPGRTMGFESLILGLLMSAKAL